MVKGKARLRVWIAVGTAALVLLPLASCGPKKRGLRKDPRPTDPVAQLRQRQRSLRPTNTPADYDNGLVDLLLRGFHHFG